MKKIIVCSLIALFAAFSTANANECGLNKLAKEIAVSQLISTIKEVQANNLINWRVGEIANYEIDSAFGNLGNVKKYVDREEGNAIWMNTEISGMMTKKIEVKLDRADGRIIEYIEDGRSQTPPANDFEVISQDEQEITVPAGTFQTLHIVGRSPSQTQVSKIELWINPWNLVMEGMVQTKLETSMMPITIKLQNFRRP